MMSKKKQRTYYLGVSTDCLHGFKTENREEWNRWKKSHPGCVTRICKRMVEVHLKNMRIVLDGKIGNKTSRFVSSNQKKSKRIPKTLNAANEAVKKQQKRKIEASRKRAEEAQKHPTVRHGRGARHPKLLH